ncbi:hypothetical protein SPONN_493 [uncultured Candidatus Thioglobus sp.]|nr:hypothetical protein SPONN_493 [uncultured Candidatus Thioglobus sp.]
MRASTNLVIHITCVELRDCRLLIFAAQMMKKIPNTISLSMVALIGWGVFAEVASIALLVKLG